MDDLYKVQCRQLAAQGSSSIEALGIVLGKEIVADPHKAGHAMLRVERDILAKIAKSAGPIPWSALRREERIFIRAQQKRLELKRLSNSDVMARKIYGLRHRDDMLKLLRDSPGGVCCFELFDEYPDARRDVLELLSSGLAVSYGTEIWDGTTSFDALTAA